MIYLVPGSSKMLILGSCAGGLVVDGMGSLP